MNQLPGIYNGIKTSHTENLQETEKKFSIEAKIMEINALQIEFIGIEIVDRIINSLGPINKVKIDLEVAKKKSVKSDPMLANQMFYAKMKSGKNFLDEDQSIKFHSELLWLIKKPLTDMFSTPNEFLQSGITYSLSNYGPKGVLEQAANTTGIKITLLDVPKDYNIFLNLNKKLMEEKKVLVFDLIEKSQNVEFSTQTFTIKELEEAFYSFKWN